MRGLGLDGPAVERAVDAILVLTAHQRWFAAPAPRSRSAREVLRSLLSDEQARRFLKVNLYQDVLWFNKEAFEELLWWMLAVAAVDASWDPYRPAGEVPRLVAARYEVIETLQLAEQRSGYQVEKLLEGEMKQREAGVKDAMNAAKDAAKRGEKDAAIAKYRNVLDQKCLFPKQGKDAANELYPRVAAHLRPGCEGCQHDLEALEALARRAGSAVGNAPARAASGGPAQVGAASDTPLSGTAAETAASDALPPPEPIEIAGAVALARAIEAEHEALRTPLRPDRSGQVDTLRTSARRRHLLLVEAALVRQRLAARRLFLDRIQAALLPPSVQAPWLRRLLIFSAREASRVTTSPPSPVVIILRG